MKVDSRDIELAEREVPRQSGVYKHNVMNMYKRDFWALWIVDEQAGIYQRLHTWERRPTTEDVKEALRGSTTAPAHEWGIRTIIENLELVNLNIVNTQEYIRERIMHKLATAMVGSLKSNQEYLVQIAAPTVVPIPDEVGQVMYQQTVRVRPRTKFNRPVEEDSWHDPYFQAVSGTMA